MRDKLNRFIDNTIGNFQEVSYAPALYQCLDLVYEWVFVLDLPKSTIQHQYAYEVFTQASDFTRQYFDVIPNLLETIPQVGDIVVWNKTKSNVAGHIGIVIEATQQKMKVYDQNKPLGTNANISDESYTNCLGFLRPKVQDDEINHLREQIKSVNEALADRATQVSMLTEQNQKLSDRTKEAEELLNAKRTELDKVNWDLAQADVKIKSLEEEVVRLTKEIETFKANNDLKAYSWIDRFLSLFRG